jgi:WD40 repeat protein
MRFWDLNDITHIKEPSNKMYADHLKGESLTAVGSDKENDYLITGDTKGHLKVWDISKVDFTEKTDIYHLVSVKYFVVAHKALINTIQVCEGLKDQPEKFIITASNDCNIYLYRLKNGTLIGQFGQENPWNIYDMSTHEHKRPKYVREWYIKLKKKKVSKLQFLEDHHHKAVEEITKEMKLEREVEEEKLLYDYEMAEF